MLREFGVDTWHMSPVSGISKGTDSILVEHHDLGSVISATRSDPERTLVFVDESGDIPLAEFTHPASPVYVLGKSNLSTMRLYSQPGDFSVFIPTPRATGGLWAHQAIALVLYDREVKRGNHDH